MLDGVDTRQVLYQRIQFTIRHVRADQGGDQRDLLLAAVLRREIGDRQVCIFEMLDQQITERPRLLDRHRDRDAIGRLHRAGQIDDRVLHELERDLDFEELSALSAKAT